MNANKNSTITIAICLIAILVFSPIAGFAQAAITFSGEAVALRASAAGISLALSDTGPLPASDGNLKTSVGSVSVLGLVSADVLSSATSGSGTSGRSQSSVANLSLLLGRRGATSARLQPEPRHLVARRHQPHRQRADEFAERKYRSDDGQCTARQGTKHRHRRRFRPFRYHVPVTTLVSAPSEDRTLVAGLPMTNGGTGFPPSMSSGCPELVEGQTGPRLGAWFQHLALHLAAPLFPCFCRCLLFSAGTVQVFSTGFFGH